MSDIQDSTAVENRGYAERVKATAEFLKEKMKGARLPRRLLVRSSRGWAKKLGAMFIDRTYGVIGCEDPEHDIATLLLPTSRDEDLENIAHSLQELGGALKRLAKDRDFHSQAWT